MKNLLKLYTLDKKGRIRVCEISHDFTGFKGRVVSKVGLLGGKLRESGKFVSEGKNLGKSNETNIFTQTQLEAESMWRAKKKEGYKSYIDMCNRLTGLGIPGLALENEEDNIFRVVRLCIERGINIVTNENWDELPMLAGRYTQLKNKIAGAYFIQPKLNGVRCLAKFNQELNSVKLGSRGGDYYSVPHIQEELYDFFIKLGLNLDHQIVLDGEIYKHGEPLQKISGAVRKEHRDMFTDDKWLEYHIYDLAIVGLNQRDRLELLQDTIFKYDFKYCKFVNTSIINNVLTDRDSIKYYHDTFINAGYEGAILRKYGGEYEFAYRSDSLIKVKEFIDEEFTIIGCKVTEGKTVEESFVFLLQNNKGNGTFYARPTGTESMKRYWFNHRESWEGKKATVRFQERSIDNLPIQGHVRADKTNCLIIENIRADGE